MPVKSRKAHSTMRDVALLAGVSHQTVSNVVNGKRDLMSEATLTRVERAIKRLDYRPQVAAQSLRSGRTRTLGFLVLDEQPRLLTDPLTGLVLAGIGDVARDRGYSLLIHGERASTGGTQLLGAVQQRRVDAALLLLSGEVSIRRSYLRQVGKLAVPFVVLDEPIAIKGGISVAAANRQGMQRLAEHLIERGHRRIGFIAASLPWPSIEERHKGYRDALESAGLSPDLELELVEGGGLDESGGQSMTEKLLSLQAPPTAIMAASDLLAAGAMVAARQRGLRVPDDLAITGFNDFSFARLLDPPLTTVEVPGYNMGATAAEVLIDQLEGRAADSRTITIAVSPRFRGSS